MTEALDRAAATRSGDTRPWGSFECYAKNVATTVKIITINPGQQLSLQWHEHRDELWVILDDGVQVQIGDEVSRPAVGSEHLVPRRTLHRLSCVGHRAVRVLEVAFGRFDEDDIERVEDAYGR